VERAQAHGLQHLATPPVQAKAEGELANVLPLLADPVDRLLHWVSQAGSGRRGPGRPILLALVGMPGSGKSTLAARWATEANRRLHRADTGGAAVPAVMALSMDGFHFSKAQLARMPNPQAAMARRGAPWTFDAKAFAATLQDPSVNTWPGFEHGVGDPVPHAIRIPQGVRVLLVEGLYLLHHGDGWHCRSLFDEAWAVDVPTDVARARTIARHMAVNGNTAQQAQARWHGNDRLNAAVVRKSARHAQFRVNNPDHTPDQTAHQPAEYRKP
jgi:pantothenate kinase